MYPLVSFLSGGDSAVLSTAALITATSIPLFNILAVIGFMLFVKNDDGDPHAISHMIIKIVKNPLIIGIMIGIFLAIIKLNIKSVTLHDDFKFLYEALGLLAGVASPLALVVLGASFNFDEIKDMFPDIVHGVIQRVIVVPLISIVLAVVLVKNDMINFTKIDFPTLIGLFSSPLVVSSVVMAYEMKNDDKLAGQIVVWSSILSIPIIMICIII